MCSPLAWRIGLLVHILCFSISMGRAGCDDRRVEAYGWFKLSASEKYLAASYCVARLDEEGLPSYEQLHLRVFAAEGVKLLRQIPLDLADKRKIRCAYDFAPHKPALLVYGTVKDEVHTWDLETGEQTCLLRSCPEVHFLRFSPDGKYLGIVHRDRGRRCHWVLLLDFARREVVRRFAVHDDNIFVPPTCDFSEDGRFFAFSEWDLAWIYDLRSRKRWCVKDEREEGVFVSLALLGDGKTIATRGLDGKVRFWDVKGGQLIGEIWPAHCHWGFLLYTQVNGRPLFLVRDFYDAHCFDARTWKRLWSIQFCFDKGDSEQPADPIKSLAVARNTRRVILLTNRENEGITLDWFDMLTGKVIGTLGKLP